MERKVEDVAHKQILCFLNSFIWKEFYLNLDFYYCDHNNFPNGLHGIYDGYVTITSDYSSLKHTVCILKEEIENLRYSCEEIT
jgi:hypothetical protein